MKKILVTGKTGQLGQSLEYLISKNKLPDYEFNFVDSKQLNLANESQIREHFSLNNYYAVINCAAYTAVDLAETEKEINNKVNALGVGILAEESKKQNAIFIHVSTDYVFDGMGTKPYQTNNYTNPQNEYGKSKLEGELLALKNNPKTIIIRTAWVYSPYGKNFVKTMQFLFENKEEISVVADQQGMPTLAEDLAQTIIKILISDEYKFGIYHYTNSEPTNWFEFAQEIKNILEIKNPNSLKIKKINPITTKDYPTPAKRPAYSVMDLTKIQEDYSVEIHPWKESLKKMLLESTTK